MGREPDAYEEMEPIPPWLERVLVVGGILLVVFTFGHAFNTCLGGGGAVVVAVDWDTDPDPCFAGDRPAGPVVNGCEDEVPDGR